MAFDFPPINATERGLIGQEFQREVDELRSIWVGVEERVRDLARDPELMSLVGGGQPDAVERRIQELTREVRQELDGLRQRTRAWARGAVQSQVAVGTQAAIESAAQQGSAAAAAGGLGIANTQAINILIDEIETDLDFAADSVLRTVRRNFRLTQQQALPEVAINESLAISEARLENSNKRAKRLRKEFERRIGAGKFLLINGKRFRLETYSELVAQTRLAEAATEGSFQASLAMGFDLVRVSDHGKTDPTCDQFAGKVFSISGNDRRFPRLQQRPPFHPRCRHVLLPFAANLKTERELEFATARSQGRVDVGTTIEEFFRASA